MYSEKRVWRPEKSEIFVQARVDQGQQKTIARFENTIRCIGYRKQF